MWISYKGVAYNTDKYQRVFSDGNRLMLHCPLNGSEILEFETPTEVLKVYGMIMKELPSFDVDGYINSERRKSYE